MDIINHPSHYNSGSIEVYDFIESQELNFAKGNVVKYVSRAGKKQANGKSINESAVEDLKKAKWYLEKEIKRYENLSRSPVTDI